MGAQDEYLRNFCILLTDKGVVPLTDPLQIAVYNSLLKGMKRPSDLTAELNMSSSSLHFIIDKMSESGIIDRIKPDTDKKTVYYTTSAKVLVSSAETNDKLRNKSEATFSDPLQNYKGLSSLANMLDCYSEEIGLDMNPIKMKYATALADALEPEKASMEDAVMNARDAFVSLTGFSFSVYSFKPLTLVVTGDSTVKEKAPMLMTFLIRYIEDSTGRSHKLVSIEDFNGSENMIKVVMDRCEKEEEPYLNTSMLHRDTERFLMIDVDGVAGLMTSDVQIDIIDAIYERPLCITDIVNKVDSPRSTITSNLLRMVEEGVISVFYSESGSAYYGLACSILLKKSRPVSSDNEGLRDTLDSVKNKEGGFMEGQLLYTLAYFKKLGFDSEYLMVVLGAKYMRATGSMDEKANFDTYFGKMSDIAQAIGLSLSIVSIYPLTIGISNSNPDSEMSQAMTFITGMAHQGLEMANSGIFVRSTETKEKDENVSFKEIYPALTMNPVKGVMVEDLAAAPKKRTSSVKTALFNRSKKESGKPVRTVRYITAFAVLTLLAAVIIISTAGTGTNVVDADTFSLTVDESIGDFSVYDAEGNALESPFTFLAGSVITLKTDGTKDIGYLDKGIAYKMDPKTEGEYVISMKSDLNVKQLFDVSYLEERNCSFSIYTPDKSAAVPSEEYKAKSNGLYISADNKLKIAADAGYYISKETDTARNGLLTGWVCTLTDLEAISLNEMPKETRVIDLGHDKYLYNGQEVSRELVVDPESVSIQLKYAEDKNVVIKLNGTPLKLDPDNNFTLTMLPEGEMKLTVEEANFY